MTPEFAMHDASLIRLLADACGIAGACIIVLAYALLQSHRWQASQLRYSAANALGAALILGSLAVTPNTPSIMIESFWLLISLVGVVRARGRYRH
jgi:hypothetical protein